LDEDALICDFAETYHIYSMYDLPVEYAATLASGLKVDSRIKMAISGIKYDLDTLLLAHIADNTAKNVYFKTKDAVKKRNQPKSFVKILLNTKEDQKVQGFDTSDDFLTEWERINHE
jgi:hypothetical protein